MKLQHKAWGLMLLAVGLLTLMAIAASSLSILTSFSDLEQRRGLREGERARRLLDQQLQELLTTTMDYAYWDDAVQFVKGQDDSFLRENITEENMKYLRLTEVLVLDRGLEPRAGARLVDDDRLLPESSALASRLRDMAKGVIADESGFGTVKAYLLNGDVLYLVAVAAVRSPSGGQHTPQGALAMVRRFDQRELLRFSDVLMLPTGLETLPQTASMPPVEQVYLSDSRALVRAAIQDDKGTTVAALTINIDRVLNQEARSLIAAAGAQMLLGGLLVGSMLILLMDRWLLRRLQRMDRQLTQITQDGLGGDGHVRMGGNDELTGVAQTINALLDRVRADAAEQKAAFARQEALQLQLMQSQKMEAIGRFTGGIAHDFNNSLAGINGWVRLAMEDLSPGHPSREALEQALKGSGYATGLMRQLMAFSRQPDPQFERLYLGDVMDQTRSFVRSGLIKQTQLHWSHHVLDDAVQADPTQLQQVLVNLFINASDAMSGGGDIHVEERRLTLPLPAHEAPLPGTAELPAGDYVYLSVCDNGPGIAPEHLDRLFEPFFTTKPVGRGTGLGLSVAHGIMARHQGSIGVSSQLGKGTCFHLFLPAAAALPSLTQRSAAQRPQHRRVLFVDDDQLVRHSWGGLLERRGWHVVRARDGEEAWLHFSQSTERWDVVLTDLTMPELDGKALAQRIVQTPNPPPVVLISGHVDEVCRQELKKSGLFADVLLKPVDDQELDAALRRVLNEAPAEAKA